jgi:hypothetical protein
VGLGDGAALGGGSGEGPGSTFFSSDDEHAAAHNSTAQIDRFIETSSRMMENDSTA